METLLRGVGFPGTAGNQGETQSPLPLGSGTDVGELRLESDQLLARDSRTACTWQGFVNQQARMMSAFKNAMSKLAVLGQNAQDLVDCSEVVPAPKPPVGKPASFPASTNFDDIEPACATAMFPALTTDG